MVRTYLFSACKLTTTMMIIAIFLFLLLSNTCAGYNNGLKVACTIARIKSTTKLAAKEIARQNSSVVVVVWQGSYLFVCAEKRESSFC